MRFFGTASFRGIPFYIRNMNVSGMNRNSIIHAYPNQKNPYIEDLGTNIQNVSFEGFVSNDNNLYMSRDLLEAALHISGTGELMIPGRGMFKAVCVRSDISETMNEKGLVLLNLEFVTSTIKPEVPTTPLGLIDTQGDLLEDALSGLGDLGSGLGALGSTLVSGLVSTATSAAVSFGVSGIDSLFSNSTCGRYAQSTTAATEAITGSVSGTTDAQKLDSATQTAIETNTNSIANLKAGVS
ncbi:DNA circularization N-terminal domain-containing protein [Gluconobacter frateurii]|uniref:DNA circularization N-terminal domain-containing protein n=1 Tax=Gluconobacter frateurii TaxID=38308 RepID=UPI00235DB523|nr:DNA circularization N-terminal domain-containing protein [Gluconobacter frateurii]GLP89599.1 hypothetical protein GCM10007868_06740 [Gluconobacter frateurii]